MADEPGRAPSAIYHWGILAKCPWLREHPEKAGQAMYTRLLAAVDHSPVSERVVAAASELAQLAHGEVWVVHVRERDVMGRAGGLIDTETAAAAQRDVDAAVTVLTGAGVKAHGEVSHAIHGHVARAITDSAEEHIVDVIVMGSRGCGDLAGLLLGSTAHTVIRLADGPVLLVR
jgi:nucleotide-binding universal stress UspA family protein